MFLVSVSSILDVIYNWGIQSIYTSGNASIFWLLQGCI